jgi:hypothetical protein
MHRYTTRALAATAAAVMALTLTAAFGTGRELARTRADSETAWQDIVRIQAQRQQGAKDALLALKPGAGVDQTSIAHARYALARAQAAGSDETVLHDPALVNTWKKLQGELAAALFMLSAPGANGLQAPVLASLRMELVRDEQRLAAARLRYSQANAEYGAIVHTVAGATVATLLRYSELPATL